MTLSNNSSTNKIYVKQSYVMLTWMSYIREAQSSKKTELSKDGTADTNHEPSFFIFPKRQTKATFLKAPMAHKTFSQEQFLYKHYTLNISFSNDSQETSLITGLNNSIFAALKLRSETVPFETNLVFLKRFRTTLTCADQNFMYLA